MKKAPFFIGILLSLALISCSKPAEVELADVGNQTKSKSGFTIDNKVKINHEANVTVVDADTGLSIDNARVRGRINLAGHGTKFIEGIELDDGGYYLHTEDLKGHFYVGALADGYHGISSYKPSFPYEIRLKKGETVTISGEIIDEFGQPVTNGVVDIMSKRFWYQYITKFAACGANINREGKFRMSNVPANSKDLCAKYTCLGEPEVQFRDQSFDTENEDLYLNLQLLTKLSIKGKVIYSNGNAVSGAWVWVEKVEGENLDSWNKFVTAYFSPGVDKVKVLTRTDGEFEFKINDVIDKYVVKACHPMYLPAYKGPFTKENPHPEMLELVVKKEGTKLAGSILNSKGEPVTNCRASYDLFKSTGLNSSASRNNDLTLEIDEDGQYISAVLPANTSSIEFIADNYYKFHKSLTLVEDEVTLLDVKLISSIVIITGTVYDAETQLPMSGATVTPLDKGSPNKTQITDAEGHFYFQGPSFSMKIAAPGYASLEEYFHYNPSFSNSSDKPEEKAKYYISPSCGFHLLVNDAEGNPLNDKYVYLHYLKTNNPKSRRFKNSHVKMVNGEVLFTNLISHMAPIEVKVYDAEASTSLIKFEKIELKAGEMVTIQTNLPATGQLLMKFKNPFKKDHLSIHLRRGQRHYDNDNIKVDGQNVRFEKVAVGKCSLSIGLREEHKKYLSTNIVISANNITTVFVNNNDQFGEIKGTVKTTNGKNIPYNINVYMEGEVFRVRRTPRSYDENFVIGDLDNKKIYKLEFSTKGNATNIVIENVKTDGPPIEIVLPEAFVVTGNVVDHSGNPLEVRVGLDRGSYRATGEFKLYPIFTGEYKLAIEHKEYAPHSLDFIVNNSNLDLGDIVLYDKGVKVSGRFVDSDNKPISNCWLSLTWKPKGRKHIELGADGCFSVSGIPTGVDIKIATEKYIRGRGMLSVKKEIDDVSSDLELGDIKLKNARKI